MDVARIELDVRRLLHRIQAALASSSHASSSEEDILKRWTYVDHLQALLRQLGEELREEEDVKRIATYENKLGFITQMM